MAKRIFRYVTGICIQSVNFLDQGIEMEQAYTIGRQTLQTTISHKTFLQQGVLINIETLVHVKRIV